VILIFRRYVTSVTYVCCVVVHLNIYTDHMERKVPKYEYHKIRERKVKTGTRKHMETVSRYFDRHGRL
jgi:hypothetical protein